MCRSLAAAQRVAVNVRPVRATAWVCGALLGYTVREWAANPRSNASLICGRIWRKPSLLRLHTAKSFSPGPLRADMTKALTNQQSPISMTALANKPPRRVDGEVQSVNTRSGQPSIWTYLTTRGCDCDQQPPRLPRRRHPAPPHTWTCQSQNCRLPSLANASAQPCRYRSTGGVHRAYAPLFLVYTGSITCRKMPPP